ncbi:flavocytochrome c [Treponema sp. Marseille-Q4130]|uniref:flavocytochrome c n=1 Tax=Treponema sp. Marseille-Q4130 TaxID=2766702 RepID=UPI001651C738|nr:flavocytochrome c [Treponema sp. Marseille-Q4130]MBC6719635.1 flavocytochrome c [Treponema sp. Marseille-Q4130]
MKKFAFFKRTAAVMLAASLLFVSCGGGSKFKAGTYTGEGTGMGGALTVQVKLSGSKIESVTVTKHNETPGISDPAIEKIPAQIVASQKTNLDVIGGCSITSRAIMQATDAALKSAGVDIEKLNAATASSAETKAADVEKTADVIVVGAGGAGMAAGVQANQDGATVIIIEKTARVGGDTIMAGGALNAVDEGSETAKANKDSVALHYKQTYEGGDKQGDPALIHVLTDNAWKGVEWLKSMGMEFKPGTFTVTGGLWPRAHKPVDPVGTGFFKTYNRYIDSHEGIEVMLNTKGESFIVENGKVVGVNAIGETGNKVTLRAKKGVVLATGGFARNVEMREKYNKQWPTLGANIPSTNPPSSTGDGFAMLEPLHAQLVQMENIQLLPLGDPQTGSLSGNIEMDVERRIFVNKNGDRFVDEGARRDVMTMALFHQPDNYMWIVLDSHCYPTGDEKNNFNESANELVAAGRAVKANSVEELAKAMNVPADHLKAALDDFNKHVADKSKDAFGRTLYSTPIDKPPFYAAPRVPTVHHTMGGVKIDTGCHVYNTDGKIIPGLYAAGEVTGGIHGANRLGGNALTDTVVFGRIAGTNAAAGK